MSDIKKLLESIDQINECPPMDEGPMPAPAPMDQGDPVRMNVNITAAGKDHVADLIDMMKNAGLGDAKPAADAMMPMRQDMERLSAMMDEPEDEPQMKLPAPEEAEEEIDTEEGYDNEPDAEYQNHEYMTKDLSGGINREKKAYAAAQRGDNAMAVEEIKAKLMAALAEKQKDQDDDGDEDFADVQIARMTASGMDKDKAIAKVKNKKYNK